MSSKMDMDRLLKQFAKEGPAGCACAVARDGKTVYEGYAGFADIDEKRPVDGDTVYRLFSMTKVIICTAAMMLYERGKFLLNEPLSAYFPQYASMESVRVLPSGEEVREKLKNPMLIRHAFTMAVGMPYANENSPTGRAMLQVKDELTRRHGKFDLQTEIAAMAKVPVAFEPGTHFLYGFGHDIVAGLIEVVSGKKVGDFLREEIFEPCGMTSTGYRYFGDIRSRMASFYNRAPDGTMTKTPAMLDHLHEEDAVLEYGGAGLFATVSDYLAFTQMLACDGVANGHKIIGRKTIDLMRRNHLNEAQLADFTNSYSAGYGYGLGVRTLMDPAQGGCNGSLGEFGWTGYAGTWTMIDPSERFSVVYMHQMSPNMEEYHHLRVRSAAYGLL